MTPVCVLLGLGLSGKRSEMGANITLIGTWLARSVWTFTSLQSSLGMKNVHNAYLTLAVSLVLAVACLGLSPSAKPGSYRGVARAAA